jgi:ketosteroid isomerase-like protein
VGAADIERLRRLYGRWARGEFDTPEFFAPDVEVVLDAPEEGSVYRGIEGLRMSWYGFLEQWRDLRVEADELIDLGDGRVLVLTRMFGRGRRSGIPFERDAAALMDALRGRGVAVEGFRGHARLLSPLLAGSLERALNLGEAMEARGYGGPARTRLPSPPWTRLDRVGVAAAPILVLIGALWL